MVVLMVNSSLFKIELSKNIYGEYKKSAFLDAEDTLESLQAEISKIEDGLVAATEAELEEDTEETTDNKAEASAAEAEEKFEVETPSQKNAVNIAKSYLDYTAFSKSGLIDQLKYEGLMMQMLLMP